VNSIQTFTYNPTVGNYPGVVYNFTPTLGTWYHYCIVCNNGVFTQYVNGAQTGTNSIPNARTLTTPALAIGSDGFNRPFYGLVDDLRIFDRALTSEQVQSIYNQQGVPGRGAVVSSTYLPTLTGYSLIAVSKLPSSFTLTQTSTGNVWTYGSGQLTDGGANPVLTLVADAPTDLYSAVNRGIWCRLGRQGGTNEYVRHANFVMFLNGYAANNFDFAWAFFLKNGTTNQVKIWNPYPGNGVGYWVQSGIQSAGRIAISTTDPLQAHIYTISVPPSPPISLTGTPLFAQLSSSAVASVGAFSLRAVNGTTAKAVQVTQYTLLEVPPVALTQNTFTATGTFNGVTNGQYVALCSSYSSTSDAYRVFDKNNATRGLTGGTEYTVETGAYIGTASTVDSTSTTYNGGWFQIRIPSAVNAVSYTVSVHSSYTLTAPYTWKLFGSTTGSSGSWVVLDTKTSYVFAVATVNFPLSQLSAGYTYFRLAANRISPSSSAGDLGPAELIIYGYSSLVSSTQDFYADRLGNLLTAPVVGQSLANWLGGATGYVTTWYDQSGDGNHATQATIASQPIIQRATKGSGYSTLFNGTTNQMSFNSATGNIFDNTDFTVCAVTKRAAAFAGPFQFFMGTSPASPAAPSLKFGYTSDTLVRTQINNIAADSVNVSVSAYAGASEPTGYNMGMLSQTSGMVAYAWRSGVQTSSTAAGGTTQATTSGPGTLGCSRNQQYFTGEIYEILIFTKSLYDLDGTSTITQVYQNQLGAYGT
jgi:hypothetical protein